MVNRNTNSAHHTHLIVEGTLPPKLAAPLADARDISHLEVFQSRLHPMAMQPETALVATNIQTRVQTGPPHALGSGVRSALKNGKAKSRIQGQTSDESIRHLRMASAALSRVLRNDAPIKLPGC